MEIIELLEAAELDGVWSEQWVLCVVEYAVAENDGITYRLLGDDSEGWLPASHVRVQSLAAA